MAHCSEQNDAHLSDEDEGLDPRVQAELEALNSAADSINKLENELQRAKNKFRQVKTESSRRLSVVYKKIGKKWVLKARPYYELLHQSHKAQVEAQKSAANFQHANGLYRAAKETVALAEERLMNSDDGGKVVLDAAWQDMLNHATAKIMATEKEKTACEAEHQLKAAEYTAIQERLAYLLHDIPRTVNRAKPFYEMKEKLEHRLHAEKQNAEDIQLGLICSKQKYRLALISLEAISDEVHTQRRLRQRRLDLPLRTPGVGAEHDLDLDDELSDMPSTSLDIMSETGSQVSWDDFSDSRCVSPALSCDFDISDTSWADSSMSPGSDVMSPEPPSTSSIWARFNSGISRFTQDLAKTSSTQSGTIPSIQISGDKLSSVAPRDDVIEGAECDVKSETSESGVWSLAESFRKFSLGLSQPVNTKSYSPCGVTDTDWSASKLMAKSHSSNILDENCGHDVDEDRGARDIRRAKSLTGDDTTAVSTAVNSMTSVLSNSSFTVSPSAGVAKSSEAEHEMLPSASAKSSEAEHEIAVNDAQSTVLVPSLSSPARLTSKPPLPQRSGTMSPRDMSSRPRLTHRRSQSLQQFTASTSFATGTNQSTVKTENHLCAPAAQNDAAPSTTDTLPTTHEIFV